MRKMNGILKFGVNIRGFTIIEIIAVLLTIAIVATVAIARFSSLDVYTLKSQTEVIKNHLRYAQTLAMNTSIVFGIRFSNDHTYHLFRNGNVNSKETLPGEDAIDVNLSQSSPGLTVTNTGTGIISFDGWGRPYTDAAGTALALQSGSRSISLSLSGDTETINITQNTGFIP